ncbi:MAG: hypothetical protein IKQ56_05300 [Lachnospiraceae bacterium]|nr:hypothetical protein [Lachnospiraceae bacterium]MCR4945769.1 hypothetical protein [Lachnospiraceae bacterium]
MAIDFDSSYIQSLSAQTRAASAAENVSGSLSSMGKTASRAEMEDAVKQFEKYFVEKMLETVEDSMKSDEEGTDNSVSKLTDYFMSTLNSKLADELIEQSGGRFTAEMVEQMARNIGISPVDAEAVDGEVIREEETRINEVEGIQDVGIRLDI